MSDELAFRPLLLGDASETLWTRIAREDPSAEGRELFESFSHDIRPTWDDSPFFFHFFRWVDAFTTEDLGPFHTSALSQVVLATLLSMLTLLGLVVVLGPLAAFRRRAVTRDRRTTVGLLVYFAALGMGFMLFEISLIQRFVSYLGYPTYAITVVLFSLLMSLGAGSFLSARWVGRERYVMPRALALVVLSTVLLVFGLPSLFQATIGTPLAVRVAITVTILAPLGLLFGMFFPLGVRRAELEHRDLVPWAWAVNGCASVTASVLAIVLAMQTGFSVVWGLSAVVYAVGVYAFMSVPTPRRDPDAA